MTSRVVVALRVKADPARTFDVFTREVAAWWQPNELFEFTPRGIGVIIGQRAFNLFESVAVRLCL